MSKKTVNLNIVNCFPIEGTIDYSMRDYSNEPIFVRKNAEARKLQLDDTIGGNESSFDEDPFFIKKDEESQRTLERVGFPKEVLMKIQKSLTK